ncbi:MAG TPA: aminotransferase class I/II-fold pyridoxal phosphate-dependent enzyme [Polyangia bacterium]|nr:aminotransferase class I/II-fold pyridoxal phosphate-dependent enzyme [Polyangia bacterium]
MAMQRRFKFSRERSVDTVARLLGEARNEGVIWRTSGDAAGRHVAFDQRRCLNFGYCSYMGLHEHPALIEGTIDAVKRFGTQFSLSRAYLSSSLYEELESLLEELTGRHVVVGASTTLCHLSALPVLVRETDAVVIDQFAHASLYMATETLGSTTVVRVRHSRLDELEALITELSRQHRRVWYALDGLYSMRGDFAPYPGLCDLLRRHPQLHLYVDDAHATSCFGARGRGLALEALPDDPRVVVALSLNKAFSAAGGAIVVSDAKTKEAVRLSGPTMSFSGPIQAPMLGAAVASARLHLAPEFGALQEELREKVLLARAVAAELGIHLIADDVTPIFMLPYEAAPQARAAVRAFWDEGFYVCPVTYPAVPISHPGVRFTISRTNAPDDIRAFMRVAQRLQAPRTAGAAASQLSA